MCRKLAAVTSLHDADALLPQAAIAEGSAAVTSGAWDVDSGVGPLHLAAAKGYAPLVQQLLEAGVPIDAPDGDGATALQVTFHHRTFFRNRKAVPRNLR